MWEAMASLLFFEFVSNRYERTFIEFSYKLCDYLKDPLLGTEFTKRGIDCPLIPGKLYSFKNFTVFCDDIPNFFPFEKGLIKFQYHLTDSKKTRIAEAFLYLSFKMRNRGKKRN